MEWWLQGKDIEIYSTHNEWKPVVAERFIRALKNKIYKYITSISKKKCIDKLAATSNKYNNAYHSTIKMKPVVVQSNTYIDFDVENNEKNLKFKVGYHLIISKYKNIFAKASIIEKVENTVLWANVISVLDNEEIVRTSD